MTDCGGVSMDPEEIKDYFIARQQELSHLVDPKCRETPSRGLSGLSAEAYVEEDSWIARRLIGVAGELPLEWHPTLEAALDDHDEAI